MIGNLSRERSANRKRVHQHAARGTESQIKSFRHANIQEMIFALFSWWKVTLITNSMLCSLIKRNVRLFLSNAPLPVYPGLGKGKCAIYNLSSRATATG